MSTRKPKEAPAMDPQQEPEAPGDGVAKEGVELEAGKAYELGADGTVRELTPEETAELAAQGEVELVPAEAEVDAPALEEEAEVVKEAPGGPVVQFDGEGRSLPLYVH